MKGEIETIRKSNVYKKHIDKLVLDELDCKKDELISSIPTKDLRLSYDSSYNIVQSVTLQGKIELNKHENSPFSKYAIFDHADIIVRNEYTNYGLLCETKVSIVYPNNQLMIDEIAAEKEIELKESVLDFLDNVCATLSSIGSSLYERYYSDEYIEKFIKEEK